MKNAFNIVANNVLWWHECVFFPLLRIMLNFKNGFVADCDHSCRKKYYILFWIMQTIRESLLQDYSWEIIDFMLYLYI